MIINRVKRCKRCNTRIWTLGYNTQNRISYLMKRDGLCYDCAFWRDIIEYPPEHMEVVKGQCLRVTPVIYEKDKAIILGGRGKKRYFYRFDGTIVASNDIWSIGVVPERFLPNIPNTAIEITLKIYNKLLRNPKKCNARACLDRYHCFRYDLQLESSDKGPYNKIPANWKIGGEHCRYFINITDIIN